MHFTQNCLRYDIYMIFTNLSVQNRIHVILFETIDWIGLNLELLDYFSINGINGLVEFGMIICKIILIFNLRS